MRILISLLLMPSLFLACMTEKESKTSIKNPDEIIICGKIDGVFWNKVKLEIVDVSIENYKEYTFEADSNDYFYFKFQSPWPSEFKLSAVKNKFEGWFFPGDSIYINGSLHKDNNYFIETLTFSGNGAEKYKYYQNHALDSNRAVIYDKKIDGMGYSYLDFKHLMDTIHSIKMESFNNNILGLDLSKDFLEYELNLIKYSTLNDKLMEPIARVYLRSDYSKVPDGYFTFLDDIDYTDSTFINNLYYYRFLKEAFSADLENKIEVPVYPIKDRVDVFTRNNFRHSDSLLTGKVKELFESIIIRSYARVDLPSFDSLIAVLEMKGYDNFILENHKVISDSLKRIKLSITDTIQVFTNVKESMLLKKQIALADYTYLSVWNIGCRGCHLDFLNKAEVYKKYKGKIQFINISTDEPSDLAEKYIAKYGDTGMHFFDLKKDVASLLGVKSYPATFLFDGEGNLIKQNFYRPGDPELQKYFDKLL